MLFKSADTYVFRQILLLLRKIFKLFEFTASRAIIAKKLHTKAEFLHSLLQINTNFRAIPNRDCHVCPEVAISLADIFS